MSTFDVPTGTTRHDLAGRLDLVLPVFAATLFLSAFLLFAVEPMFTKMVLPVLGGSPSVWSVAMFFFQTLLLAGYVYAHLLTRYLGLVAGAAIHAGLMALAFAGLPLALNSGQGAPPQDGEMLWLLATFTTSIGLPFFIVAANGPLLQSWFARSGHAQAKDPYFLYGASNIGSFFALIAYPFLIEPLLGLSTQSRIWTAGFLVLAAGIVLAAALVARRRPQTSATIATSLPDGRVDLGTRARWILLSAVPSGLLVSVTAHISTDIAAAPLVWVVPLALFLLTFVVVFRNNSRVRPETLAILQVFGVGFALMNLGVGNANPVVGLVGHLGLFFVTALVCHRALYEARPSSDYLTGFYVSMSFGGALGGLFAGLVAPNIFSTVLEYPILIVAGLFCQPGLLRAAREAPLRDWMATIAISMAVLVVTWAISGTLVQANHARLAVSLVFGPALLLLRKNASRVVVLALFGAFTATIFQGMLIPRETYRSFFGVNKVTDINDGTFRGLMHGTTLHGAMRVRLDDGMPFNGRVESTTYYTTEGPMGEAIRSLRSLRGRLNNVSVIGLGVGALACQMQPGERMTYYEIDPVVVRLATDARLFRFLSQCTPDATIVTGDARMTIAAQPASSDMIVVDAFSSDAIPVHLLTREAVAVYLSKLDPHGVLVFHISNNSMRLDNTVAALAAAHGLSTWVREDLLLPRDDPNFRTGSIVAVVARNAADLGPIGANPQVWKPVSPREGASVWTDDYSSILGPIADKLLQ